MYIELENNDINSLKQFACKYLKTIYSVNTYKKYMMDIS